MNTYEFTKNVFRMSGVLIVLFLGSCTGAREGNDVKWSEQSFHRISYKIPKSWDVVRTGDSVEYGRPGVQMNAISIRRFKEGTQLPDSNFTVDTDEEIWSYADEHFEKLKRKPDVIEVNRTAQNRFPALGDRSFIMKARSKNVRGVDRDHWIIGALIDDHYYRIAVQAERHSHLPAVKEEYVKFKLSLQLQETQQTNNSG